jgi:hypothetical protein
VTAQRRREIDERLGELITLVGVLDLRVAPADAVVRIDGGDELRGAQHVELDPGDHLVLVTSDGYAPVTRTFTLTSEGTARLDVQLAPLARAAASPTTTPRGGALRVWCAVPAARIVLDGRRIGAGGPTPIEAPVAVGAHVLAVDAEGYEPWRRALDVHDGDALDERVALRRRASVLASPWFYVGAGGAVVALAAVAVLGAVLVGPHPAQFQPGNWGITISTDAPAGRGAP